MKREHHFPALLLVAATGLYFLTTTASHAAYDLSDVKDMKAFQGSAAAKELLHKNGFVVADPSFKQIFEAYIKSPEVEKSSEKNPMGRSLPSLITTDSAWHTYHVLLEEGVKQMEEVQAQRLHKFSRQLLRAVTERKAGPDLVLFASVGLALQDKTYRQSLTGEEKHIADALCAGTKPVEVPIGFSLSPLQFRAQSFYTQSPELSDYFAARQWYASVVFRLANPRETQLAVSLAMLVNSQLELLDLWKQLSNPYDVFLASAEDGTIPEYAKVAKTVIGTNLMESLATDRQITEIQKKLEAHLPPPQVNDQLLSPEQYMEFGKQTRGFRLLPPRRLPCAVCFHNTVDPKIPGRMYPSGLDFLAASPVLRSPAAVRAVQSEFGKKVSDLILKADCGPMPDSLHGEAMQLLATLQKPLPARAPAALQSDAWSDLQLWTQLGAWAEQRHTWALHTKLTVEYMGIIEPPMGMVAPYPEFFTGLAKLTRRTAGAFAKAGLDEQFDAKTVASELSELFALSRKASSVRNEKEFEKMSGQLEQLGQFQNRYFEKHRAELEQARSRDGYKKLEKELDDLARRCAENGATNEADMETLKMFFDCRQDIVRLINDFAPVCDRLAELATKSLNGQTLTEDDAKWIENYGVTLAGFHFYYGNSYEVPRDDFPIVTRVYSNPLQDSMLYAGLARPQALYVIVPAGKSLQLYRGAVMTYREFVRPNDQLLDDESWRELISKGQTPPAPPFTKSFYAETSVSELLKKLQAQSQSEVDYGDMRDLLWQIGARATEKDLPELFNMLNRVGGEEREDIVEGIGQIIAQLPWQSYQQQIIELLASPDHMLANAAARILIEQPAALNAINLLSDFTRQPECTRRLYCAILSRLPQQTEATHKLLLQALHDPADGVRWQAAMAIGKAGQNDAQSQSALLETLNDTNEFVGAAAAWSLAQRGATNTAPVLFEELRATLQSTNATVETLEHQALEITRDLRNEGNQAARILDPDHLELRLYVSAEVTANMKRRAAMRLPPRPFDLPSPNYNFTKALIEALGDLGYTPATDDLFKLRGTDYDAEATRALAKLAPDRLSGTLLATALDKQIDSYIREKALVTLCAISSTNHVRDLVPLLDDTTPIVYERTLPGPEWRVCDRAAITIAVLLGWENQILPIYIRPEQREGTMKKVREWANSVPAK